MLISAFEFQNVSNTNIQLLNKCFNIPIEWFIQHFSTCAERMKGYLPFSHFIHFLITLFPIFLAYCVLKRTKIKPRWDLGWLSKMLSKNPLTDYGKIWKELKKYLPNQRKLMMKKIQTQNRIQNNSKHCRPLTIWNKFS